MLATWNVRSLYRPGALAKLKDELRIRRLEWIGHVIRMNETRSVKIFEGKLDGRRGRGRPRLRWIDNVEDDLTF